MFNKTCAAEFIHEHTIQRTWALSAQAQSHHYGRENGCESESLIRTKQNHSPIKSLDAHNTAKPKPHHSESRSLHYGRNNQPINQNQCLRDRFVADFVSELANHIGSHLDSVLVH